MDLPSVIVQNILRYGSAVRYCPELRRYVCRTPVSDKVWLILSVILHRTTVWADPWYTISFRCRRVQHYCTLFLDGGPVAHFLRGYSWYDARDNRHVQRTMSATYGVWPVLTRLLP